MPKPVSFPFPIRPLLPANSAFGKRPLYGDFHSGIDFNSTTGAYLGTPVRAAGAGTVVESYNGNVPGRSNWDRLRGTMVRIDHGDGWWTRYHMLVPNSNIAKGTKVKAGDIIGRVGSSGSSTTGPHLHFELWKNGVAIDPVGQLTYNSGSFAGTGSTPIDNEEDDMTPEQSTQLTNIYNAIFNGGPSMSDGGRSIEDSLAGLVKGVDQIIATTSVKEEPKVVRNKNSKATLLPADGSNVTITKVQDDADTNSLLREIAARPAAVVDVNAIVTAVVAAVQEQLGDITVNLDLAAIAKAVNDDAAARLQN